MIFLGSQLCDLNIMLFMSYNINIYFDLVGGVVLLGKLLIRDVAPDFHIFWLKTIRLSVKTFFFFFFFKVVYNMDR